jgi:hypothetical protein
VVGHWYEPSAEFELIAVRLRTRRERRLKVAIWRLPRQTRPAQVEIMGLPPIGRGGRAWLPAVRLLRSRFGGMPPGWETATGWSG